MAQDTIDTFTYLQFLGVLGFVICLVIGAGWLARRFGVGYMARGKIMNKKRQLSILEVMPLDTRNRLALVANGRLQHLILLGPQGGQLVHTRETTPEDMMGEDDMSEDDMTYAHEEADFLRNTKFNKILDKILTGPQK